jgi:hypothetical protein
MADMVVGPRPLSHRIPKPNHRDVGMDLVVLHVSTRRPSHHGRRRRLDDAIDACSPEHANKLGEVSISEAAESAHRS